MVAKIVRLFPNRADIRFEWPVHEQLVTSLNRAGIPIEDTTIEIIHTGYANPEVNAAKQSRNLRILERITATESSPHPMALFLHGGALLDLNRIPEALELYKRCAASKETAGDLLHGATVRICTCLSLLQRPSEIIASLPSTAPSTWHPELLLLAGEALVQTGRASEGIALLELGLASPHRALIPAYDPVRIKARCTMALAGAIEKTNLPMALALLKLAAASIQQAHEITPADVASILQDR